MIESLAQDVRHAARALRRTPGLAAAVIVTLALGVGANAAMFAVIDRLMLRPYPYLRDPATVHRVYFRTEDRGTRTTRWDAEYTRYLDLARWTTSLAQTAGFTNRTMAVGVGEAARERRVAAVSASFFAFFDARPALGRFFTDAEDRTPRGADVAVLGYDFWKRELGGRDVRGQVLQVGDIPATIVGVAPEGFVGVDDADPPAVYVPITTFAGAQRDAHTASTYFLTYQWRWMEIIVRRKPGVSAERASADVTQAYRRSWAARRAIEPSLPPAEAAKPNAVVSSLRLGAGPDPSLEARTALWVAGVAAVVLVIACANVANLLLARALRRRREVATRLALGASRGRLIRSTLAESVLLALAGGAAGLLVARWAGAAIRRLLATGAGPTIAVTVDGRTVVVALAVAVAAGLATGLAAALLAGRGDLAPSLRGGARGGTSPRSRARSALLVVQGALSVALLVGAGLFVRSVAHVQALRLGFDADSVLVVSTNLRGTALDDSARARLGLTLLEAARATPGVERAAWVNSVPFWRTNATRLFVEGVDSTDRLGQFTYLTTTPDYFRTMGTRIVRGRPLTDEDRGGAPRVMVVSESMARALWPGRDPLGRCVRVFADTMPCATVVGVAEDIVQESLTATTRLHYYLPIAQFWPAGGEALLIRTRGDPARAAEPLRRALQRVMPGQAYVVARPLGELADGARRSWRLGAAMFAAFGVLAVLVAAVGLYGVIGYDVARRAHELGVRVALGARAADVARLVVGEGARLTIAGIAAGAGIALAAGRWLQPLLFRESAADPVVYGAVAAAMLVVALVASASPALRAARTDPNAVLRAE
jgi:predicted permease